MSHSIAIDKPAPTAAPFMAAIVGFDKLYRGSDKVRIKSQSSFGDFSINYDVVFYLNDPAYAVMMDTQEAINLEVFRKFEEEGVAFAFPTQSIYVESMPSPA